VLLSSIYTYFCAKTFEILSFFTILCFLMSFSRLYGYFHRFLANSALFVAMGY